jgi:uncharacterized protein YqgC (DUF456 family)
VAASPIRRDDRSLRGTEECGMDDSVLIGVVAAAMAVGVVGTVVPVVPGLVLVWAGALVYGLGAGFGPVGVVAFTIITALALAGIAMGFVLPQRAAARRGAARSSMWFGAVLALVGFFVVPLVGVVLGGVLGVFLGEMLRTRDAGAAWHATAATLKAFGVAGVVQLLAGLAMVAVWVPWVVYG